MKSKEELAAERSAVYHAIEAGATTRAAMVDATGISYRRVDAACKWLRSQGKIRVQRYHYPHWEVWE